jgi:hypothetical protein
LFQFIFLRWLSAPVFISPFAFLRQPPFSLYSFSALLMLVCFAAFFFQDISSSWFYFDCCCRTVRPPRPRPTLLLISRCCRAPLSAIIAADA